MSSSNRPVLRWFFDFVGTITALALLGDLVVPSRASSAGRLPYGLAPLGELVVPSWARSVGYIHMFGETPISWCPKKESLVALSSCETKYIVALLCVCQVVWMINLLKELGSEEGDTITLMVDNVSTINFAKNPISHGRSEYIEMNFHYLKNLLVKEG